MTGGLVTLPPPAPGDGIIPISPLEAACGWPFGLLAATIPKPRTGTVEAALAALEQAVVARRGGSDCFVAFSGGRDSSAVLAVATRVARRQGLPDPIPVTERYPAAPDTDESEWQESVIRFLGLKEWLRLDATEGGDLVGSGAQTVLGRHGVVWPPTIGPNVGLWRQAAGGVLLTGEGGDAVFAPHRPGLLLCWLHPFPPSGRRLRLAAMAALPGPVRRRSNGRRNAARWSWLTPAAHAEASAAIAALEAHQPLHAFQAIVAEWWCRAVAVGIHNMGVVAASEGTILAHPLVESAFLAELAPVIGRWGFPDRASLMKAVFGDLLATPILERRSKAEFGQAYFGPGSRAFAAQWDGSGVDTDLVDIESLRRVWSGPEADFGTFMLLQQAWVASTSATTGAKP